LISSFHNVHIGISLLCTGVFVGAQSDGSLFALSNQFSPSRVVAAAALASAKNTTESVKGIGQRSDIQVEENTGEDGTDADEEPDQEEHEESPDPQVDQPGSESDLENSESAVDELSESEIEGDADEADASKPRSAASERARERRLIRTAFAPGSWTHSDMFMPGSRSAKLRDTGLWLTALPTAIAQSKATNSAGLRAALLPWTRINVSLRDGDNVIGLQRQNSEFAGTDSYLGFHFMPFGETRSVRLGAIDLYYAAQSKRQMEQPHLSSRWLPLPPDWVPADVDDYGELPLGLPNPQDIISRNLRDVPLSIAPPEPTPSWHPLWIVAASALGTVVVVWLTRRFLSSGVVAPASVSNSSTTALSSGRTQRHVDATGREVVSIGKISYFPSAVLGLGSHGTMVYEGALDGRPIAVKRLLAAFVEAAQQEMSLLIATDQHPNVLRYHAFEQDGDFVYVALEQCHGALAALFERECPTSLIPSGFFDQRVEVWVAHMPNSSAVTVSHAFHPSSLCASAKQFPSLWERSQNDVLICSSQALALLVDSATESLKTPLSNDEISNEAVAEPDNSSQHSEGSSSESDSEENSAPRFVSPPPGLPAAVSWRDKASATSSIAAPSKTGDIAMTSPLRSATAGRRGGRIQRGRGGHRKPAEPAIRPVEPVLPPAPKPIFVVPEHWPRQRQLLYPSPACVRLLRETMAGVAFLHGLNIVHRDIKPQNLLLAGATHVAKIADMGLGKKLSAQSSSFGGASSFGMRLRTLAGQHPDQRQSESSSMMVSPAGSAGWIAPEMLQEKSARLTKAVDIFSLGCVFHFTITGGLHPFGGRVERDSNIIRSRVNLSELELMPEAHDLIASMLLSDPSQRPSASECLAHPFFWNDSERMTFLETVSDYLEAEPQDSALRAAVEGHACTIVSGNWEARLDAALLDNLGKHRKYDFGSAIDCLRLIRNKKHHFHDLPLDVQAQLGPLPSGFVRFFLAPERFPRLLLFLWQVLAANLPVADASPLHRFLGAVSERTRARLRDELQIQHRRWWPAFPL
jgi:serine/threonine protein kinase